MEKTDLLISTRQGIYCPAGDFFLDPKRAVHRAVITHAHADHAVAGNTVVHCTAPTAALMQVRYGKKAAGRFIIHDTLKTFSIGGIEIHFLHAGHMLGSVQVMMKHMGQSWLFTGDFKLQHDATCAGYVFSKADVLVTETTFASPLVKHPDPLHQLEFLNQVKDRKIIIACYVMGKAQRLTSLIAEHCPGKTIFIHRDMVPYHRVYESFKASLGLWKPYSTRLFRSVKNPVYLVSPKVFQSFRGRAEHHLFFASGWEHHQKYNSGELRISDHADWNDLLDVIRKTGAQKIITMHGDGTLLKKHFRNSGIEVSALPEN